MAMSDGRVTASTNLSASGTYPPQGVTTALRSNRISQAANVDVAALAYGTSSGQVDLITCSDRTINATSTATYDLYTGTDLKDLSGLTCAFRKVKLIQVNIISGGDASGVRIGGAAANTWAAFFADATDKSLIFPSGPPFLQGSPAGAAVGSSTKNLLVENLGAVAVTVRITIAGTSV